MCSATNPIFSIFYTVFGAILKACCAISGNYYVIALFIFSLIIQVALFPLAIKQQKSSVKMGKFRPKEMLIREKYKGRKDKATQQKMNMEVQELYRKEGHNPYSGCLPILIQLPIIIILWGVIKMPLTYTTSSNVDANSQYKTAVQILDGAVSAIEDSGLLVNTNTGDNSADNSDEISAGNSTAELSDPAVSGNESDTEASDIANTVSVDTSLAETREKLNNYIESYTGVIKKLGAKLNGNRWDGADFTADSNYEFTLTEFIVYDYRSKIIDELIKAGIDEQTVLENIPENVAFDKDFVKSIPKFTYFGETTLLDIPSNKGVTLLLLIPILVFITSFYGGIVTKKFSAQPVTADGMMPGGGFMKWGLPLLSTWFAWQTFPAAIGVYWIYRTVLGIGQSYILARMYPIPKISEEELAELKKQFKTKKKKVITIEVDEDDDTYDGMIIKANRKNSPDTRYEMLSPDDDKSSKSKIDRAPLKDDNPPPDDMDDDSGDDTDED
ncbi:MAG: membrane protein insertase YidC [Eubacteriales bacterium]|nr:membrane protein insertase YidC [Eubacteriales bacterium]